MTISAMESGVPGAALYAGFALSRTARRRCSRGGGFFAAIS